MVHITWFIQRTILTSLIFITRRQHTRIVISPSKYRIMVAYRTLKLNTLQGKILCSPDWS
uniref:Uncharacterized protein n=1 Tax=Arundo donax TaxID=35708 RepID=A0A0A9G6Y6_ARUDO